MSTVKIEEPRVRKWPAPLREEAFCGLAGEFVNLISPQTEADDAALLFSFLIAVGSIIGRAPYYQVGGTQHHVNLFVTLVGETGRSRKGTSWGECLRLAARVDEDWREQRISSGLCSGEGLINAVRDPTDDDAGIADKRLLIAEGELSQALQAAGRNGNTLSAIIRLAFDSEPLRSLAKNAFGCCLRPHISVLGHITVSELRRQLTTNDIANGFANRFLWVCVARSKCLPFGGNVDVPSLDTLAMHVRSAVAFAQAVEQVSFADEACDHWELCYPQLSEGKFGLFGAVVGRAEAQAVRLATLYALLDQCKQIRVSHLDAALACWRYCYDSAAYIFGDAVGDATADEILLAMQAVGAKGMTRESLVQHFSRHKSGPELTRALTLLQSLGLIRSELLKTSGRPAEIWFPVMTQDHD